MTTTTPGPFTMAARAAEKAATGASNARPPEPPPRPTETIGRAVRGEMVPLPADLLADLITSALRGATPEDAEVAATAFAWLQPRRPDVADRLWTAHRAGAFAHAVKERHRSGNLIGYRVASGIVPEPGKRGAPGRVLVRAGGEEHVLGPLTAADAPKVRAAVEGSSSPTEAWRRLVADLTGDELPPDDELALAFASQAQLDAAVDVLFGGAR